jgi:hypothetical protein
MAASAVLAAAFVAAAPGLAAAANPPSPAPPVEALSRRPADGADASAFELFLDRLRSAESGDRRYAKNPRSTALGPYQFIDSTFLDIARRHFPHHVAGLSEREILALRTDPDLSRTAAAVLCRESMAYLKDRGFQPTFAHLRLAYLLGPAGAARILAAPAETSLFALLPGSVIAANPFMRGWRVADLLAKSERDISPDLGTQADASRAAGPRVRPAAGTKATRDRRRLRSTAPTKCNTGLASCRKFLALGRRSRGA